MSQAKPRVALIWANFGPYHLARANALGSLCELWPIEMAAVQRHYGWQADRNGFNPPVRTLTPGAYEDQSPLRLAAALYRILDELQPEIVLIPGWSELWALTAALWVRLRRRRAILMSDSTFEDRPRSQWRERFKSRLLRQVADAASVGGARNAAYLEYLGVDRSRIAFYYDVVDNEFFSTRADQLRRASAAADFGLPAAYFLYVGRLAPEKNLGLLLNSFARYVSGGGCWSLMLVGDGPLAQELRVHPAVRAAAGRVSFVGFKNGPELIPYYAFAGCFVLASLSEPWGLVVNEAMASGLPVIVSRRCGCSADLVEDGSNGYLFDPNDEAELAACMLRVASAPNHVRAAMASRSRQIIAGYTPENWAEEIMRMINRWTPASPARAHGSKPR